MERFVRIATAAAALIFAACSLSSLDELKGECVGDSCHGIAANCQKDPPEPKPEACNGLDDDCDSEVDEAFGQLTCGENACQVIVQACQNGKEQECTPWAGAAETCDGVDNDCDGQVDEECKCDAGKTQACYPGAPGTQDVGVCKAGLQGCTAGSWGACDGPVTPKVEACNGLDDDCNGLADDGNPHTGAACDTGNPGVCKSGIETCTSGTPGCQQLAPSPLEATAWTQGASYPYAFSRPALCIATGGKLYVSGDSNAGTQGWAYDLASNSYTQLADAPVGRSGGISAVFGTKLYAVTDLTEVYDTATNQWELKAPPPANLTFQSGASALGKLYAFMSETYEYDPGSDVWTTRAAPPNAHGTGASAATVNDVVYLLGGVSSAALDAYDPKANSWQPKAPFPWVKSYAAVAAYDNKIWVMSGGNWETGASEFYVYDVQSDTWSPKPSMLDSLNVGCGDVIDSTLVFVGGQRAGVYGTALLQRFQLGC